MFAGFFRRLGSRACLADSYFPRCDPSAGLARDWAVDSIGSSGKRVAKAYISIYRLSVWSR